MTIRKGEDWGFDAPLPADGVIVATDAQARSVVEEHRRANREIPPLGLLGGDLWKALGAPTGGVDRLRSAAARTVPIDLGVAVVDGRMLWFVSHLFVKNSWWRGRVIAVMNTEFRGDWRVVSRAHPNDGVLDVVDGNPGLGQRWLARRRLQSGDHLPHPQLQLSRVRSVQFELKSPTHVWLDGIDVGRASQVSLRVEEDALTVVF